MRILTTAAAAALIGALSVAYGLEEQTEAIERRISSLERERDALQRELDVLGYEWRAAISPERLARLSSAAFEGGAPRDLEGEPLAPWRVDQLLSLGPPRAALTREREGELATSSITPSEWGRE